MSEIDLHPDFRDFLVALVDAEAEFVLLGGWAVAVHGHPRGTDDLDVLVRPAPANAERVYAALAAFGAPVQAHGVEAALFAREGYGYRMGVKPHLIEVLTVADGITFDEAMRNHREIMVDGRRVPVIGRDALIQNKKTVARPQDLADVEWLETHPDEPR